MSSIADRAKSLRAKAHAGPIGKRQLKPENLPQFLRTQGGLNALYLRRPLTRTSVRTKVLHLTESVEIPKDGEITLALKRTPENTFEVLAISNPQRTP